MSAEKGDVDASHGGNCGNQKYVFLLYIVVIIWLQQETDLWDFIHDEVRFCSIYINFQKAKWLKRFFGDLNLVSHDSFV